MLMKRSKDSDVGIARTNWRRPNISLLSTIDFLEVHGVPNTLV